MQFPQSNKSTPVDRQHYLDKFEKQFHFLSMILYAFLKKKILYKPKIVCILSLLFFIFNFQITTGFAQTNEANENKFSLSLNPGISVYTDGDIYRSDGLLELLGLDYLEFSIGYKLSKNTEIGISLGKNEFTFDTRIYESIDSTLVVDSKIFRKCNWLSLDFNFYPKSDWFLGLKLGMIQPVYGHSETLIGILYGNELIRFKDFYFKFKVQYLAKISSDELTINSNQLNFLIGLGFNF